MKYQNIIDYYNQCRIDYQLIWGLCKYHSIHYGYYDQDHKTHAAAVENFNRILARIVAVRKSDIVIDVGCGVGGSAIWLAKNIGCSIIGININEQQLQEAQALAKHENLGQLVSFELQNYNATRFASCSFDVVWGLESVCYAANKKDFLIEAFRLLKPGGRLIIADGFLGRKPVTRKEQRILNQWLEGWAVPHLSSHEEFNEYLQEIGFVNVSFQNVTKNVLPSSRRMFVFSVAAYPLAKLMQWLKLRTDVQMKNLLSAYYQKLALDRGLWQYGIYYAKKL